MQTTASSAGLPPTAPAAQRPANTPAVGGTSPAAPPKAIEPIPGFRTPDWVKDAIFYQVFPDRFANGDPTNDPKGTRPWGSQPTNDGFMGGDLVGLRKKLGYLKDLGVNALYLNPVFSSPSNHGYNTTDYEHVESRLGGDKAYASMVDAAHDNGMKVMLDGVFNHTSHEHGWFKDVRERGPESPYFDRYDVTRWPIRYQRDSAGVLRSDDYKSWWNYAELPELRTDRPDVRDYFLTGKDSVVRTWLRDGKADGWRMDVADEVEHDYWKVARKEIKQTNPNAYLLAEAWQDSSEYLRGDEFDGAMNYRYFQQPAVSFFAKKEISADEFVKKLANPYPTEARQAMFNLLDSHDTPRFVTEAGGDWYRLRPAAIFQMTYVGAPVIYYGDELGMEGGRDPDCRRAFPWETLGKGAVADARAAATKDEGGVRASSAHRGARALRDGHQKQLLSLYQTLTKVRTEEPALRRGDFEVLATHNADKTVSFRRSIPGQHEDVLVAINNDVTGHDLSIPAGTFAADGTRYVDRLSGRTFEVRNGAVSLGTVDGNFGAILVRDAAGGSAATARKSG